MTDVDYADDLVLFTNTSAKAESLLHSLEPVAWEMGLYVNANKTEFIYFRLKGAISTLTGMPVKLKDQFTYLNSNISSTERDINIECFWQVIKHMEIWSLIK